ncbi:MAG: hypothetical protein E7014_04200 [Alphaproteobacteria bacterium]|nr:hypothetical protein [Alphaproteobacteria bacterium]
MKNIQNLKQNINQAIQEQPIKRKLIAIGIILFLLFILMISGFSQYQNVSQMADHNIAVADEAAL